MKILEKHHQLKTTFGDDYSFEEFINHLNTKEILFFLEKLFQGDSEYLCLFFSSHKNIDLDEIAFDYLQTLPGYLVVKISKSMEIIFQRAIENHYVDNSNGIINKIITYSNNEGFGLSSDRVINLVFSQKTPAGVKLALLYLLKDKKQMSYLDKFVNRYQLSQDIYLLPFIIDYLGIEEYSRIMLLLDQFKSFSPPTPDSDTLKWFYSISYDIIQYADKQRNDEFIYKLVSIKVNWLNDIILSIIKKEEFNKAYQNLMARQANSEFNHNTEKFENEEEIIARMNNKYTKKTPFDSALELEDARYLLEFTRNYKWMIPKIEPLIRSQISINSLTPDLIPQFISDVDIITSVHQLSLLLNESHKLDFDE